MTELVRMRCYTKTEISVAVRFSWDGVSRSSLSHCREADLFKSTANSLSGQPTQSVQIIGNLNGDVLQQNTAPSSVIVSAKLMKRSIGSNVSRPMGFSLPNVLPNFNPKPTNWSQYLLRSSANADLLFSPSALQSFRLS